MADYVNLNSLKAGSTSPGLETVALISDNLGSPTLKLMLNMREAMEFTRVANITTLVEMGATKDQASAESAQRELRPAHAANLSRYVIKGAVKSYIENLERNSEHVPPVASRIYEDIGADIPYVSLQPITVNIREAGERGSQLLIDGSKGKAELFPVVYLKLKGNQGLWVIDGQHRRMALHMLDQWCRKISLPGTDKYPVQNSPYIPSDEQYRVITPEDRSFWAEVHHYLLTTAFLAVEAHLGLERGQERQLFHDLNSKTLAVGQNLSHTYDQSNAVNLYVGKLQGTFVPNFSATENATWEQGLPSRTDLVAVFSLLAGGAQNAGGNKPPALLSARLKEVGGDFAEAIKSVPGFGNVESKKFTVVAQPIVMKAIARLAYDCFFENSSKNSNITPEHGKCLLQAIKSGELGFGHDEPLWRALMMSEQERLECFPGIEDYLYIAKSTNLIAGSFENGYVRFSPNTKDLLRRLGDLIRYQLKLPARIEVTKAIAKAKALEAEATA